VGDFKIPLSAMDRSSRQKINREIMELTNVTTQMDLADIYRTFHPNIKEYTFFSAPHRTIYSLYIFSI
jgi:exonuclease III